MKRDCEAFRSALEAELLGRPSREKLAWLSWNEHLLSCGACRDLLEKEEALETLLATLPEPRLPAAIARRVLRRLRSDRGEELRLDDLLDLGLAEESGIGGPEDLAGRILARLEPERRASTERLDRLLDLDRDLATPPGLAERVLVALAAEREVQAAGGARRSWIYAAAAGLLLALLGRALWVRARTEAPSPRPIEALVGREETAPDPELLASLDVVEQWDLLMQDDVDVLLSTLGPADLALLDYP